MPENSTWDDVMYEIYVRQKIDKGFEDIKTGKLLSHDKVKQLLKLKCLSYRRKPVSSLFSRLRLSPE
jgi:hypothetical protein